MEFLLTINDNYLEELYKKTGISNINQLTTEAFSLFKYAVDEVSEGKIIVSKEEDNSNEREIWMPTLENAKYIRKYKNNE